MELKHKVIGTVGTSMEEKPQILKTDLQSLIELGCVKDSIQIGGFNFTMRSLNAVERTELVKETPKEDSDMLSFNIKLLSLAIESINNVPLERLHPSPSKNVLQDKIDIISNLQSPVIMTLLKFYSDIMERCDGQFSFEQIKN